MIIRKINSDGGGGGCGDDDDDGGGGGAWDDGGGGSVDVDDDHHHHQIFWLQSDASNIVIISILLSLARPLELNQNVCCVKGSVLGSFSSIHFHDMTWQTLLLKSLKSDLKLPELQATLHWYVGQYAPV